MTRTFPTRKIVEHRPRSFQLQARCDYGRLPRTKIPLDDLRRDGNCGSTLNPRCISNRLRRAIRVFG